MADASAVAKPPGRPNHTAATIVGRTNSVPAVGTPTRRSTKTAATRSAMTIQRANALRRGPSWRAGRVNPFAGGGPAPIVTRLWPGRQRAIGSVQMRDVLPDLMDAAAGRSDYADVRHVRSSAETLSTRNGQVESVRRWDADGFGVRVRIGGAWGFAAARGSDRADAEGALARAIAVAEAQPRTTAQVLPLATEEPASGSYSTPLEIDPLEISLEDKLALLSQADAAMQGDPRIALTSAHFEAYRDDKVFCSTEGAYCEQRIVECGGGIAATATSDHETQVRSYPGAHREQVSQAGYEHFAGLRLAEEAPRGAGEAGGLLTAPRVPAEVTTLVLNGEQVALQVHESVGHAVELDRVLGREASYAGTSFVSASDLDTLRYGSAAMNVTADATVSGGLGTFGWDDEGVAGHAVPIVREGVLRGFLSSRETAAEIGLDRSGGCMRAEGFARQPLVRVTNVH